MVNGIWPVRRLFGYVKCCLMCVPNASPFFSRNAGQKGCGTSYAGCSRTLGGREESEWELALLSLALNGGNPGITEWHHSLHAFPLPSHQDVCHPPPSPPSEHPRFSMVLGTAPRWFPNPGRSARPRSIASLLLSLALRPRTREAVPGLRRSLGHRIILSNQSIYRADVR